MENIIAQQLVKMQGEILGKIRENGLQEIGQTAEALFRVVKTETCELLQAILPEFARRRITEEREKGEIARKDLLFLRACGILYV